MSESITQKAGAAFFWQALQHAGTKIIFLVRMVVLARLLSPDDFGLLAVSMVAVGFMNSITDFGMIPALVQRSEAEEAHYNTAWTIGIIRGFTITVVVFIIAPLVATLFNEPRATPVIRVLALLPVIEASASIKIAELVRDLHFRSLTVIRLVNAIGNTAVAIALAASFGIWALVAGALAGPLAVLVLSYILAPYAPRFVVDRTAAHTLIRFGRWIFLTALIAVLGNSILRLVISRELGTAELGLYFLAASLAFLPSEVASKVVGEVTFPLYSRLQANGEKIVEVFQSVLVSMLALLIPICFLLGLLAPALVEHILGGKWEGTVPVIQILAFVSLFSLLGEAMAPILKGIGQPSKVLIAKGVQSITLIAFVWLFTRSAGLSGAAMAWLPAIIASQVINVYQLQQLISRPFTGLLKPVLVIVLVSAWSAFLALKIYEWVPEFWGVVLSISLSLVCAGLLLWGSDRLLSLGLMDNLAHVLPIKKHRIPGQDVWHRG